MKLLTAAIIKQLAKTPYGSTGEMKPEDVKIIVKFFCPWNGWTWYVIEGSIFDDYEDEGYPPITAEALAEGKNIVFFGLVEGQCKEIGPFLLRDLESIVGPGGLKIERDIHFEGMLSEVL